MEIILNVHIFNCKFVQVRKQGEKRHLDMRICFAVMLHNPIKCQQHDAEVKIHVPSTVYTRFLA